MENDLQQKTIRDLQEQNALLRNVLDEFSAIVLELFQSNIKPSTLPRVSELIGLARKASVDPNAIVVGSEIQRYKNRADSIERAFFALIGRYNRTLRALDRMAASYAKWSSTDSGALADARKIIAEYDAEREKLIRDNENIIKTLRERAEQEGKNDESG